MQKLEIQLQDFKEKQFFQFLLVKTSPLELVLHRKVVHKIFMKYAYCSEFVIDSLELQDIPVFFKAIDFKLPKQYKFGFNLKEFAIPQEINPNITKQIYQPSLNQLRKIQINFQTQFYQKSIEQLFLALKRYTHLTEIALNLNNMDIFSGIQVDIFKNVWETKPGLKKLSLFNLVPYAKNKYNILSGIQHLKNLQCLDLWINQSILSYALTQTTNTLFLPLPKLQFLKHITIKILIVLSQNVSDNLIKQFAHMIKNVMCQLEYLNCDFSFIHLGKKSLQPLLDIIKKMENLRELHLNLDETTIKETAVGNLMDSLSNLREMQVFSLNLSKNLIQKKSLQLVVEGIKKMEKLTKLQLGLKISYLRANDLQCFGEVFQEQIHLEKVEIDLQENRLEDEAVVWILNGLGKCIKNQQNANNNNLREVKLQMQSNKLGKVSADSFLDFFLEENGIRIISLDLRGNCFDQEGKLTIQKMIDCLLESRYQEFIRIQY